MCEDISLITSFLLRHVLLKGMASEVFYSESYGLVFSRFRTSDKRKNMAKQKAEAQKRLYGQNPIRRLSPGSSDWEQQRHQLERRKEELVRTHAGLGVLACFYSDGTVVHSEPRIGECSATQLRTPQPGVNI